jgi:hypothetical protein
MAEEALRPGAGDRLLDRWHSEWRDWLRRETAALLRRDLPSLDDQGLLLHLDDAERLLRKGQYIHFVLWIAYALSIYELDLACNQLLGWDPLQALTLVAGTSQASSAPGRALTELAAAIRRSPDAREIVERGGSDVLQRVREAVPDVAVAVDDYLAEHGHRTRRSRRDPSCWPDSCGTGYREPPPETPARRSGRAPMPSRGLGPSSRPGQSKNANASSERWPPPSAPIRSARTTSFGPTTCRRRSCGTRQWSSDGDWPTGE